MKNAIYFFLLVLFACSSEEPKPIDSITPVAQTIEFPEGDSISNQFDFLDTSFFKITSKIVNGDGFDFEKKEVLYDLEYLRLPVNKQLDNYLARTTIRTKSCTGCEEGDKKIKVQLYPYGELKSPILTFEEKCDKIDMEVDYYATTKYGCCGAENDVKLLDYNSNIICEGVARIVKVEVPNSDLTSFIGYNFAPSDSLLMGAVIYSFDSKTKFAIEIPESLLKFEDCTPFSPVITVVSDTNHIEYKEYLDFERTFELWYLNKASDRSEVFFDLKLEYECEVGNVIIMIPFRDGLPFGKEDKISTVSAEYIKVVPW